MYSALLKVPYIWLFLLVCGTLGIIFFCILALFATILDFELIVFTVLIDLVLKSSFHGILYLVEMSFLEFKFGYMRFLLLESCIPAGKGCLRLEVPGRKDFTVDFLVEDELF